MEFVGILMFIFLSRNYKLTIWTYFYMAYTGINL